MVYLGLIAILTGVRFFAALLENLYLKPNQLPEQPDEAIALLPTKKRLESPLFIG
jgi:hypothetical protein